MPKPLTDLERNVLKTLNISVEQYDKESEEYVKQSVKGDVDNIGQVEALQMQMIEGQGRVISMLMTKISELEAKVNA
jgi:hypothetical protein